MIDIVVDIVVAYYKDKNFHFLVEKLIEELRRTFHIKPSVYIYDKSTDLYDDSYLLNYENKYENKFADIHIIQKQNIGREGETYLHHILEHYNHLNEYIIFLQDDTNVHIRNYDTFVENTVRVLKNKIGFYQYECCFTDNKVGFFSSKRIMTEDSYFIFEDKDILKKVCGIMDIYLPKEYDTEVCSFFIVNKEQILKHNLLFYDTLRNMLLVSEKQEEYEEHKKDTNIYYVKDFGVILEILWKLIFCNENEYNNTKNDLFLEEHYINPFLKSLEIFQKNNQMNVIEFDYNLLNEMEKQSFQYIKKQCIINKIFDDDFFIKTNIFELIKRIQSNLYFMIYWNTYRFLKIKNKKEYIY